MKNIDIIKEKIKNSTPYELSNYLDNFFRCKCVLCEYHHEGICCYGCYLDCRDGFEKFLNSESCRYRAGTLKKVFDYLQEEDD